MGTAAKSRSQNSARLKSADPDDYSITSTDDSVAVSSEIVSDEQVRYIELIQLCDRSLEQINDLWYEVWLAVAEIKQKKLFRIEGHGSFTEFCKNRFGWEQSNSYANANAGDVVSGLLDANVPKNLLPKSVSQAQALTKVNALDRPEVLKQAFEMSEGRLTEKAIESVVETYLGQSESGATLEELQSKYATLPNTRLIKVKNGRFNYAVEQTGKTASYRSLKEVEAAFEDHQRWITNWQSRTNGNTTQVVSFNGTSAATPIAPTDETTEETIAPTDEDTFDADSDEGTEVVESREESIEIPLADPVEDSQVEAIDVTEEEESDEEYESPSFDPYQSFESVVKRVSILRGLDWTEDDVRRTTNALYDLLMEKVEA